MQLASWPTGLLSTLSQQPVPVDSIVMACCCLHKLMRKRYPGLQNAILDREDENHQIIPGAWRYGANLDDLDKFWGGNCTTWAATQQRLYLKHYLNSPAAAVPWQNDMVRVMLCHTKQLIHRNIPEKDLATLNN
jgi:hypothetical protein